VELEGKHIIILGAGRSGRAAAGLALRHGASVAVYDKSGPAAFAGMPDGARIHPEAGAEQGHGTRCDLLVVSPGIDTYGPYVASFAEGAWEVIGEVELASRFFAGRIVGITGTNGKTTTTELVERVLRAGGISAPSCGNYGVPFAEVVMGESMPGAVSLELSSFQLETVRTLHCDVAIWLNFAPDHMDRYPTVDAYYQAKLRIFQNQTAADTAIIRAGEKLPPHAARVVTFSTDDRSADWFSDGHMILHQGGEVLDIGHETGLRGLHNAENLMAAMAAGAALGVPVAAMRAAFRGYAPPPHRCELIRTLDGVEYLNDSKATNLHALESALRSQTRPVVLIAGGKEKGLDYTPVVPLLRSKGLAAVTFGQIAAPLAAVLSQAVPTVIASSLEDAVARARAQAPRGSSILFSPGTSSFDMFTGYEQRGDIFRSIVKQLA
jgi:UDP-N-acetylmuramoylalanine--D-glutamate ligase